MFFSLYKINGCLCYNFSINLLSSVILVVRLFLKKKVRCFFVFCLQISFALPYLVNSEYYRKGKYNQLFMADKNATFKREYIR